MKREMGLTPSLAEREFDTGTYYKILGISPDANEDEIRLAFLKLSKKNHPDQGGDTKKYQFISEAYTALKDPTKRREYDLWQTKVNLNDIKKRKKTPGKTEVFVRKDDGSFEAFECNESIDPEDGQPRTRYSSTLFRINRLKDLVFDYTKEEKDESDNIRKEAIRSHVESLKEKLKQEQANLRKIKNESTKYGGAYTIRL